MTGLPGDLSLRLIRTSFFDGGCCGRHPPVPYSRMQSDTVCSSMGSRCCRRYGAQHATVCCFCGRSEHSACQPGRRERSWKAVSILVIIAEIGRDLVSSKQDRTLISRTPAGLDGIQLQGNVSVGSRWRAQWIVERIGRQTWFRTTSDQPYREVPSEDGRLGAGRNSTTSPAYLALEPTGAGGSAAHARMMADAESRQCIPAGAGYLSICAVRSR